VFRDALGEGVAVYSQPDLVAEALADYLARRPEFIGDGQGTRFVTTGDPASVWNKATQFLRRRIEFTAADI
jgi:Glutamate racemase